MGGIMTTIEYTTDSSGSNLVEAEEAIKDGTPVIVIQVTADLKHVIAIPPHEASWNYSERDMLRIFGDELVIREYKSWLFVEETTVGVGKTRPRGSKVWGA